MPDYFQNRVHRFNDNISLVLGTLCFLCVLSLSTPMQLSSDHAPPPRRIIAYVCMNPKCEQSFTNLHSYDRHRTHARNVNTLCASLMMRREIVATRRTGVTTSVVTEIPRRGMHDMVAHARYQWNLRWKVRSARTKELEHKGKYFLFLEKISIIRRPREHPGWVISPIPGARVF